MNPLSALALGLAWLAIVGISWLGLQLLRQNGRLLLRLDELEKRLDELEFGERQEPAGLPLGTEAPAFELPDLAGEIMTLARFRGRSLLLIFFNPACGYCRELAPKLAALSEGSTGHWPVPPGDSPGGTAAARPSSTDSVPQSSRAPVPFGGSPNGTGGSPVLPSLIIITTGDTEKNRQFFAEHKLCCPVLLQKQSEVATAYQATGTPSGYLISPDGKIASELAMGAEALLALAAGKSKIQNPKSKMNQSLLTSAATGDGPASRFTSRSLARSKIKRDGLKAGTPAPDFRLPRLDSHGDLTLSELRGKRVLLVFSSPHCGPCSALAPALEKFHRDHAEVEVVMISRGEPKENRAKAKEHGLTFPVVLQQQWEISRRYAIFATPIAYLIDEAGVITHDVAVGVEPIFSLVASLNATATVRELLEPAR